MIDAFDLAYFRMLNEKQIWPMIIDKLDALAKNVANCEELTAEDRKLYSTNIFQLRKEIWEECIDSPEIIEHLIQIGNDLDGLFHDKIYEIVKLL